MSLTNSFNAFREIGYLPVSQTGGMYFFQLMSRRYERASTVLTSNKPFEELNFGSGDPRGVLGSREDFTVRLVR
jgi:DNA replication protein DnaC